jgi:hypothetical protein
LKKKRISEIKSLAFWRLRMTLDRAERRFSLMPRTESSLEPSLKRTNSRDGLLANAQRKPWKIAVLGDAGVGKSCVVSLGLD